jgi:RHS repeat-associated protein
VNQEYQDHFGPVNPLLTPKVTYSYSEASGGNHSRLTTMTYPNGRTVQYEYDPGIDTAISRLSRLTGDAIGGGLTSYEEYEYLGASTMIERGRPESGIKLTMVSQTGSVGDAGDPYTGLDRFGRVVDQRWIEGSGGSATDIDRYTYQFDRNSSRTARLNQLDAAFSETYAFDGVDRLVDYARGGGGSGPQDQQWNLDALGNWTTITTDGTPESRTHNSQNELTGVGASSLAYDANGNMIQDEAGRQLQYNAWNRLVRVSLAGNQVAAYQYDGYQHRIVTIVGDGPSAIARDLFYSAGWQVLEQRIRTGGSLGNAAEEQFVWSVAYIDGLILRDRNTDLNNATGAGGLEQRVYALHDALWNTTALVDVNGDVLNRFAYTPYGVVETLNANWTPTASPSIPWAVLFRGYFADEGTGLLHARNRQYSPTLGRFVGRDPLKYVDGYSLYAAYFVPDMTDPEGTIAFCDPFDSMVLGISWEIDEANGAVTAVATPPTGLCRRAGAGRLTSLENAIADAKKAYDAFECPACCTKKSAYSLRVMSSTCNVDSSPGSIGIPGVTPVVTGFLHLPVWTTSVRLTFRCMWTI